MKKLTLILTILALGSVFGADALAADSPSPQEQQFSLAAQPAVKISVRDNGWYSVSRKSLVDAGLKESAEARLLHLYADGAEVPILVRGLENGRLAPGGSIEFYGRARNVRSTNVRAYWLVAQSGPGERIAVGRAPRNAGVPKATSFLYTSYRRNRLNYTGWPTLDGTYFFGPRFNPSTGPADQTVTVDDFDPQSESATLRVAVRGITTKRHNVKLTLNGSELGAMTFEGQVPATASFTVSRKMLKDGANTLTFTAVGGELDFDQVDEVRITYARLLRTRRDLLNFRLPARRWARVTGFTRRSIRLIDISDEAHPRLLNPVVRRDGKQFALMIGTDSRPHRYLALTADNLRHPSSVGPNRPSTWHDDNRGADLLIISHRNFIGVLRPLKELRQRQGLKVSVVDVQDVYDEFSFGAHTPDALKAFVMWTRSHWRPAPRFLMLVGDATYDPRKFSGKGTDDFVPTKFTWATRMELSDDGWFGDANNDGIPELAIGRLPVQTKTQAKNVIGKIVGYDRPASANGHGALLVADADGQIDFNGATDAVRAVFPGSVSVTTTRRSDGPNDAAVRKRLLDRLNQGPAIVNYFGHGAMALWSNAGLFNVDDAANLHNGSKLSLYVMMSCLNGYFTDPKLSGLAEVLLRAKSGGAVAVVSSTGLSDAAPQPVLNREFFRLLFANPGLSVGQVMNEAKKIITDTDLRREELLFGDPSMHLRY